MREEKKLVITLIPKPSVFKIPCWGIFSANTVKIKVHHDMIFQEILTVVLTEAKLHYVGIIRPHDYSDNKHNRNPFEQFAAGHAAVD